MKRILNSAIVATCIALLAPSCIKETLPQGSTLTGDQVANAEGSFDGFVDAITSSLTGAYFGDLTPWDYGYPSSLLQRDVMGQDIAIEEEDWNYVWYTCSAALNPGYLYCQIPWTYYYTWIKNCNTVISLAGGNPSEKQLSGLGIAHAMRAMFYMDLARMFAPENYATNPEALTVPIVTESTTPIAATHNPRATNTEIWSFILEDLDKAEIELADYVRTNVYTPDLSVVYGLKARAYLETQQWEDAVKYAQKAMEGYTMMSKDEYLSKTDGFNVPNGAWMFGLTYRSTDEVILENDADTSWGSQMIVEVSASECGYAANYVGPKRIDAHLQSTIPSSDFRSMCFLSPELDNLTTAAEILSALEPYTDDPEGVMNTALGVSARQSFAGISLKFRPKNGEHADQYAAFTVAVPLMRVEEMKLIEAEAKGMLDEAAGIELLTAFALTRDAEYVYGKHNEDYGNKKTSAFQNEVWWQRRVELWGEGFSTLDIKRLNKGIIRNYAGTNHLEGYLWNTTTPPSWMTLCIVGTEANYNEALVQNPIPIAPSTDSDEYVW